MAAPGSHTEPVQGGPWGGEAFLPILSAGLWSSPSSLPQWSSRETDVPSSFVDRKPIPPWSSNSNLATDHKVEGSHPLPHATPADLQLLYILLGLSNTTHLSVRQRWIILGGHPYKGGEEDPLAGHFGDSHHEAFCKDLDLVQCTRQTYFRTHLLTFHKEVTCELTDIFREMAEMVGLLGSEVHLVQDQWKGRKELCSANCTVRGSAKDLHYFRVVSPLESPKIMGLGASTPPRLSSIWPASHSAHGVERRGRMRALL